MWNYIVKIIGQKRAQHEAGSPTPEEQQAEPRAGIGNERKQFHSTIGPTAISKGAMLTDTDQMMQAASTYGGGEAAGASGAAELGSAADVGALQSASSPPTGASGNFELEGPGGTPQGVSGLYGQAGGSAGSSSGPPLPPPTSGMGIAQPQAVDVFGGQEYGQKAAQSAAQNDPQVMQYIEQALKNYARNKVGKKIGRRFDQAADIASMFGDKGESTQSLRGIADWLQGSTHAQRKRQGLYGNN